MHPKIHGGILARRDEPDDLATLERQGFLPIDLVVVNLYPFEATVARPDATFADAIENIDIGGPALIRAAAKNHAHVAVLTSPEQYEPLIAAVRDTGGTTLEQRRRLALAAFRATGSYDQAIADYLGPGSQARQRTTMRAHFPNDSTCVSRCASRCATAKTPTSRPRSTSSRRPPGTNLATATLRHGKELSYNNLLDLDSALATGPPVRRAGGLHPQAQQPLRRRDRRGDRPARSSAPTRAIRSVPSAASWA